MSGSGSRSLRSWVKTMAINDESTLLSTIWEVGLLRRCLTDLSVHYAVFASAFLLCMRVPIFLHRRFKIIHDSCRFINEKSNMNGGADNFKFRMEARDF